ncbi:MAG: ribonuclease D [Candidatus Binatia bacterium]|nr:MAG: ribonuclease D [Candidatus Binatia bacterium]
MELFVDDARGLEELARRLRREPAIGLDTEFVGERTYTPVLELVQVSTREGTAVVDCRAVGDPGPLFEVLHDPKIEKVLHAGQQDLEILYRLSGKVPAPVFDTQIAAAMVGLGYQPGYASLVERLLHTRLEKTETLTDWSRRPLSPAQLAYAHADVRYLLPLREKLLAELRELGREEWVREEFDALVDRSLQALPPAGEAYLRVRGRGGLRKRNLAILRELAAWREEEARRTNKPRQAILSDEILVEIARRAPEKPESLGQFRPSLSRSLRRYAKPVLEAVRRGARLPAEEWPAVSEPGEIRVPGVLEVLQATLRLCASEARVAPALVATTADLRKFLECFGSEASADVPLLRGWRYDVAGRKLRRLLEGKAALRIDPKTLRLRIEE